ncbi:MAG TPA: hypothetical protein GX013_01845 [Propionibacterium sp.]|nr:hypothetical protein [Propionibacterium sp.]
MAEDIRGIDDRRRGRDQPTVQRFRRHVVGHPIDAAPEANEFASSHFGSYLFVGEAKAAEFTGGPHWGFIHEPIGRRQAGHATPSSVPVDNS